MAGWNSKFHARTIIYSREFEEQSKLIQPDARRLDEQLASVEWAIATNPEAFPQIPGTILRMIKTDPFPDAPPLRVFFSIDDDDHCTAQWIEIIEEDITDEEEE